MSAKNSQKLQWVIKKEPLNSGPFVCGLAWPSFACRIYRGWVVAKNWHCLGLAGAGWLAGCPAGAFVGPIAKVTAVFLVGYLA
jgi:hypothetical protein